MSAVLRGASAVVVDAATVTGDPLVVVDGRVAVGPPPADAEHVDVTDCIITPGLVNAHHHLLQSAFRSTPATRNLPMRDWLTGMARRYAQAAVDPDLVAAAAAVGSAESLLCGVTTVADHHLTWPTGQDPVALAGATITTARRIGVRLVFVRGTAGEDPDVAAGSVQDIHTAYLADARGGVTADGYLQLAVGPAGLHADGPETYAALAEAAERLGVRRRTQANEQVDVEVASKRYRRRPLDVLDEWGWLAPDVTLAHVCDITDAELNVVAQRGVSVTHAPGCDVPMGWGVARVAALRRAGVPVGLGTSGGGSNDAGHLLADARLAMQLSGLIGEPVSAPEMLGVATEGSAIGLGRGDVGHLRCGAAADLCVWDAGDVFDAGASDPVGALLWSLPGRRPRDVMVGGSWVVRDGVLLTADSRQVAAELNAELRRRTGLPGGTDHL